MQIIHDFIRGGFIMSYTAQYQKAVFDVLSSVFTTEAEKIDRAGAALCSSFQKGGLLYVFGCGHSHMISEELFYRAGGLAAVYPIFETSTMLHEGAAKSSRIERMSGYAELVMERYPIGENDCFLDVSTSGINSFTIEMAQAAKRRGAYVIGISSGAYLSKPSRQKDGLHLPDVCDLAIDNHVPAGDAIVQVCADGTKAGPVSSIASMAIANSIVLSACEKLSESGTEPVVYHSGNCEGGDKLNEAIIAEYQKRIRCL